MWDDSKKMFKKKKIGQDGEVVNEDHKHVSKEKQRIEKMKERYKNWRKGSLMNLQKVGDREVRSNSEKAQSSFKNRMVKKQLSDMIKRKKEVNHDVVKKKGAKEAHMRGRKVRSELKSFNQIAKDKASKRAKSFGKGGKGGKGGNKKGGFKKKN